MRGRSYIWLTSLADVVWSCYLRIVVKVVYWTAIFFWCVRVQSVNYWIFIWHLKFTVSYNADTEVLGSHDRPKMHWKRCPFDRCIKWGCDDAARIAEGKLTTHNCPLRSIGNIFAYQLLNVLDELLAVMYVSSQKPRLEAAKVLSQPCLNVLIPRLGLEHPRHDVELHPHRVMSSAWR